MDNQNDNHQPSVNVAQARGIVGGPYDGEPREILDGWVTRKPSGFDAVTDSSGARQLYIPFSLTTDPIEALLACRAQGLLREKLDRMDSTAADLTYCLTIPKPILPS